MKNIPNDSLVKKLAGDLIMRMGDGNLTEAELLMAKTEMGALSREDLAEVGQLISEGINETEEGTKSHDALNALMAVYNDTLNAQGWGEQSEEPKPSPIKTIMNMNPRTKTIAMFGGGGLLAGLVVTLVGGLKGWSALGAIAGITAVGATAGVVYTAPKMDVEHPFTTGSSAWRKCYNAYIRAGYTPEQARGFCSEGGSGSIGGGNGQPNKMVVSIG